jgi:hypothetical protein
MAWKLARSLEILRKQVNDIAPNRSKASDGTIGNEAHKATNSDHNEDASGTVRALDLTHDPANGFDSWAFAEMLRQRQDSRIKYVISNDRIFAGNAGPSPWVWRAYNPHLPNRNKHIHHVHISVLGKGPGDDPRSWDVAGPWKAADVRPTPVVKPLLRKGSPYTADVSALQRKLGLTVDGIFGPKTEAAVKAFQKANGLTPDGLVGPYSREKLGL